MNPPDAEFAHYMGLQKSARYLAMDGLEDRCLYLIHARNSHIGQWVAADKGFVILREKFGSRYLFTEYHWDSDGSGTAKPLVKLSGPVPAEGLFELLDKKLCEIPYAEFMNRTRPFIA